MPPFANPIFCALDTNDADSAMTLAREIKSSVGGLKIGMEAFYAIGTEGYERLAALGLPIFLDLKLHDIPNTVAGGIRALLPLRPGIVNVHASGGPAMMAAAMEAAKVAGENRPKIIAVTVLTSLDDDDLRTTGISRTSGEQALHMARLAQGSGLDGVVCSPHEITAIKAACGADFLTIVPGIRPGGISAHDQKRVMSPNAALAAGADILVIGRPITAAAAPAAAAAGIARGLAA